MTESATAASHGHLTDDWEKDEFVGRAAEIGQLRHVLTLSRLVTLTGPGGVGKSRLAVRFARDVRHLFSGGVFLASFADLSKDTETFLVDQTLAQRLGLKINSTYGARDAVLSYLNGRHCLIVLDNCEHLTDKLGPLVTELLREEERLHILASSRETLGCRGEYLLRVPPLSTADSADSVGGEAMELLTKRAATAGVTVRADDSEKAGELCRQLDGLPLAIELAAASLTTVSLDGLLMRISEQLATRSGAALDVHARHRTLPDSIGWSYQLCTQSEKILWRRAAVFAGEFDLDAAQNVCSGDGVSAADILDIVESLIRKSIILVDTRAGRARYRLLETLRQYGALKLAESGEEQIYRKRHHEYFLAMSEKGAQDWFGPREMQWLDWVRGQMPNLRLAMEHDFRVADGAGGLRIAVNLGRMRAWFFSGWPGEGRSWLERGLAAVPQEEAQYEALRAAAMGLAGFIGLLQGDLKAASEYLKACSSLAPEDVPARAAWGLLRGAHALIAEGNPEAIDVLGQTLEVLRGGGPSDADSAMVELYWAFATATFGERDIALAATRRYLKEAERHGAEWQISWARWAMGVAEIRYGDKAAALELVRESIRGQRDLDNCWGAVWGAHALVWALAAGLQAGSGGAPGGSGDAHRERHAQHIAQSLGAARRLSQLTRSEMAGPGQIATSYAEQLAREVLGDAAFIRGVERGQFRDVDDADARHRIFALLIEEQGTEPESGSPESLPRHPEKAATLTSRERDVAALVAAGDSNPEIGRKLLISSRTVQTHVAHILRKQGLRNRQEIAVWHTKQPTSRNGFVEVQGD